MNFDEKKVFQSWDQNFRENIIQIAQKYHFLPYLCDNHAVWTFGTTETEKSGSGPDFGRFSDMVGFNNPGNHCSPGTLTVANRSVERELAGVVTERERPRCSGSGVLEIVKITISSTHD